ncbi:MAG: DUF3891 family protein, partial [Chloroflexi bacterium]|nr:DUF3891 family protein [Chloroflexota bacterium]
MILRKYRGQLLVVHQPDHGDQCADFARHWGNAACDRPVPLEALEMAADEHDNGWAEWEVAPAVNPDTGQPYQVFHVPADQHIGFYRIGIARVAQVDPYAGVLVSMHGAGLYCDRYGTYPITRKLTDGQRELVASYLDEQAALQARLRGEAARDPRYAACADQETIWRAYKLLQVLDRLSLQFCYFGCASGAIAPAPLRVGAPDETIAVVGDELHTLRLAPYPFDESPRTFPISARLLPDRRYRSTADFLETYERA